MTAYPKWKYHAALAPRVVGDPDEEAALGAGWADTPAAFAEPAPDEREPELAPEPSAKPKRKR